MNLLFDIAGNGAVTLLNGLLAFLATLASPITFAVGALAVSFTWLARIEVDELDRQGTKPDVQVH